MWKSRAFETETCYFKINQRFSEMTKYIWKNNAFKEEVQTKTLSKENLKVQQEEVIKKK